MLIRPLKQPPSVVPKPSDWTIRLAQSKSASALTFAFVEAGADTDKGPYQGGSDTTSAWSVTEQSYVTDVFDHVETIVELTISKISSVPQSDMDFQLVENAPGGFAGYADFPSDFFVGDRVFRPAAIAHDLHL